MALILSRIAGKFGILTHSFSLRCSNFCYAGNGGTRHFSSMLRIDFSSINDIQFANFLFREMSRIRPQPSAAVFNKLLTTVVNMEYYSVALSMFDEMRQSGLPVNEYTFSIIMHCYCLLNRVDFGFAVLGSFFKLGYEPDVAIFTTLMKGLFLDDKAIEAEKLFSKLLDDELYEPCEVMIGFLINGLCKAGYTLTACNYLELLAKRGCNVNAYSYSTVIDGLCKGGMVEDALQLLRTMIDRGVLPNFITYTSMVHGMCSAGRWEDMRDLLHKMFEKKMALNVATFNVLVNMLCKNGKVKEAADLLGIMMQQNVSPDIYTYNALMEMYCLDGQIDVAKELFDSLEGKGLKPDVYSYGSLIAGYCRKGKVKEAEDLLEIMVQQNVSPIIYIYTALIDGYCSQGEMDKAKELLDSIRGKGLKPNMFGYSSFQKVLRSTRKS